MIDIQEFRVGNFVLVNNTVRKICLISNDTCSGQAPGIGYELDEDCRFETPENLQPVPLTDGLLEDYGFRFHKHFKLWQHQKPDGTYSIELDGDYSALDFSHRPIRKHMKHLHILQNVFFTIQGLELDKNISSS